jgi:hypothetical protein
MVVCIAFAFRLLFRIFKERCPPRQKSRVERLKKKVEPLLTYVTVENGPVASCEANLLGIHRGPQHVRAYNSLQRA